MPPLLVHLPPEPHPLIAGNPAGDWLSIRRRRAEGAGSATKSDRRSIFSSALEQAEELFRAANAVDDAVRPILLFYGMSQASRAVAACAASIDNGSWRLSGHGLTTGGLEEPDIGAPELKPTPGREHSNFGMMQELLAKEGWSTSVTMREVWDAIPQLQPLGQAPQHPPLSMEVRGEAILDRPELTFRVIIRNIPEHLLGNPPTPDHMSKLSSIYPTLKLTGDYVPAKGDSFRERELLGPNDGFYSLRRAAPDGTYDSICQTLGDGQHIFPGLGGTSLPPSEFTLWWAMLYAMSMRARYQPDRWRHDLDVDANPYAVPLEAGLSGALVRCPQLIDTAIRQVAAAPRESSVNG